MRLSKLSKLEKSRTKVINELNNMLTNLEAVLEKHGIFDKPKKTKAAKLPKKRGRKRKHSDLK